MFKNAISALVILGIGVALGTFFIGGRDTDNAAVGSGGGDVATGERKIAYWQAPMNPGYTADKPGKSPMGMDLVPVYEDELGAEGTVQIDPVTVQNIGVKTKRVEERTLERTVRAVGRVDYDETRLTDVNTKITGWVEKLYVDYTGQEIKKGQPMLEIYSPELVSAQDEYLTALDYHSRLQRNANDEVIEGAGGLLRAAAQRLRYWDITDEQIAELERTRQVRRTMTIYSPQQGIVVHKNVFNGAHIKSGQHLYRIAELSKVWVYADIYEYEIPWIKLGQKAEVELSYLPGQVYWGVVTYIYPFLDAKTRTVKVRIAFDNPHLDLKPGMYANVKMLSPVAKKATIVPVQAIIRSGKRSVIIVALGDGKFEPRDVVLGVEAEGDMQILKGLRAGEIVVTSSQFLIDSESNLKAAVSAMSEPEDGEEHDEMEGMQHDEMEGMQHDKGSVEKKQAAHDSSAHHE